MKPKLHLQYPKSTLDGTNSFITFRMYDYSSAPNSSGIGNIRSNIQRSAGGNFSSENLKKEFTKKSIPDEGDATGMGSISLYLPQNLEYNYGANWKAMQFGALGAVLERGQSFNQAYTQSLKIGGTAAANVMGDIVGSALASIPKTSDITLDNVLGASFGITFNDNTLQTFDKMETRTFNFKYVLVARDASEESEIKKIIKFFKIAMHPDATENDKNNTIFLKYPYIFRIIPSGYKTTTGTFADGTFKTTLADKNWSSFLPNTKYCGLRGMNVSYTPNNVISLTPNNFVTAVTVGLEFIELTNLTRKDIVEVEDSTLLEGYEGDQKGIQQQNFGTGRDGTSGLGTFGFPINS